jgi:hypothetical protein
MSPTPLSSTDSIKPKAPSPLKTLPNMNKSVSIVPAALTLAVLAVLHPNASAQNSIWAGGTNPTAPTDWNATNPTNWVYGNRNPGVIPNAINQTFPNAPAIFTAAAASKAITLSGLAYANNLFFYGDQNYSLDTAGGSFYTNGGFTNFGSGAFTLTGPAKVASITISGTGLGAINLNGPLSGDVTTALTTTSATYSGAAPGTTVRKRLLYWITPTPTTRIASARR